ncbi:restriction endonuclease subunit S [Ruminococcus flavefaciens]|uniref:restriction endonuclease subunit S n=1 Tax=Ruminococcus flavefaciens TaxID=1265 RepID=UPI0026F23AD4|nr:restriction endonuclease subunit S [Ruminococcus flavefaciens]
MDKTTKKSCVPAIRFKGFTDTWEQREVGDILEERIEMAPKSDEYPLMAFIANEGVAPKGERYDRSSLVSDTENKPYKRTKYGDFIYSSNNLETGSIGLNKYGNASISPVYSIFYPTGLADSDFIGRRLVRKDFINEMVKWRQGVIYGQWRIHESDFIKIKITVPTLNEQQKIGQLLDSLDRLITLHQRKLDKLHNVKKSLLEKMFPKNGADKPEIRFKGFTHAWEQRTVGVFYDFKNGLNKGKAFFGHGTPIVNFTDVFHNRSLYCKDLCGRVSLSREEINNFNVHKGDLFFTRTSETIEEIGYSSVMMDEPESTVFSGFVLRGRAVDDDPLENIFKSYVFFTDTFRKEMIMKSSMTTRALTSGTAIKKMLFYYPSDKTEQKRIGSLLEHLDHLITLHQRKLEKLQQIKKSLLEKMFV